nr:hypothetical protein GCM10025730_26820 [Promicromonospora thailandica]
MTSTQVRQPAALPVLIGVGTLAVGLVLGWFAPALARGLADVIGATPLPVPGVVRLVGTLELPWTLGILGGLGLLGGAFLAVVVVGEAPVLTVAGDHLEHEQEERAVWVERSDVGAAFRDGNDLVLLRPGGGLRARLDVDTLSGARVRDALTAHHWPWSEGDPHEGSSSAGSTGDRVSRRARTRCSAVGSPSARTPPRGGARTRSWTRSGSWPGSGTTGSRCAGRRRPPGGPPRVRVARTVDPARHEARRLVIIDAALTVFAQHGYDGATTAAICRQAGIGSGTFFHYFPTKRDVLLAILTLGVGDVRDRAERYAGRTDALGVLLDIVRSGAEDAADPRMPGFVRAVGGIMQQPDVAEKLDEDTRAQRDLMLPWVERAQRAGRSGPTSTPAASPRGSTC